MQTFKELAILSLAAQDPSPHDHSAATASTTDCPGAQNHNANAPMPRMARGPMAGPMGGAGMPVDAMQHMQAMHTEMAALREEMKLLREELSRSR